jgi:hypothetical protein
MTNAFDVYRRYLAMKNHFSTPTFDYFKYHGRTNASVSSFEKRRDKFQFGKLATRADYESFLLANIVHDPGQWVGNLFDEGAEDVYLDWKRRTQSLTYLFEQEIHRLDRDFNSNFIVVDGGHPPLLSLFLSGQIHLETLVILDSLLGFVKTWDKQIKEPYIWPSVSLKLKKYKPFLSYNKKKMRQKLLDLIGSYDNY